jgi:hypothetical protein
MKSSAIARFAVLLSLVGLPAITCLSVATGAAGCGEGAACDQLRSSTLSNLESWESCDPNDPEACIVIPGNPRDCTGVLACDIAVNPHHRGDAEQAVLSIAQQSQSCFLCAVPNCAGGSAAWCEPVTRRCMLVAQVLDGGTPVFAPGTEGGSQYDAGAVSVSDSGVANDP